MTNDSLLRLIEARTAIAAIGASTLRNQGARNVVSNTWGFLGQLYLKQFAELSASGFTHSLDTQSFRRPYRLEHGIGATRTLA
jgi:hypothetical protein